MSICSKTDIFQSLTKNGTQIQCVDIPAAEDRPMVPRTSLASLAGLYDSDVMQDVDSRHILYILRSAGDIVIDDTFFRLSRKS